ncbi:hypothetical protein EZV62_027110 [Acer yangbiense]|uniref:CCHC-type domain-containing protein n=1 Tax=Acer yangbiense TaxID=1000413 RepID=A0A5C7GUM9_9ROSI|nr:hypothetical protein EZV62_027110 [Acer yangbiense]
MCGNCGELGHNVRSCKAATAASSSKLREMYHIDINTERKESGHNTPPIEVSSRSNLGTVVGLDNELNHVF